MMIPVNVGSITTFVSFITLLDMIKMEMAGDNSVETTGSLLYYCLLHFLFGQLQFHFTDFLSYFTLVLCSKWPKTHILLKYVL